MIEYLNDNQGFVMAVLTGVYVVATVWLVRIGYHANRNAQQSLDLQREHNRLSVRPHLVRARKAQGKDILGYTISVDLINNGLGPAIITNFQASYCNKNYDSIQDAVSNAVLQNFEYELNATDITRNYAVRVGEAVNLGMLKVTGNPNNWNEPQEIDKQLEDVHLRIEYESLYGDVFVLDSKHSMNA